MTFKDLPEGQTHFYNDGCGEPAHNDMTKQYDWEEELGMLVRDITRIGFMPKSEVRRRVQNIINIALQKQKEYLISEIEELNRDLLVIGREEQSKVVLDRILDRIDSTKVIH